LQAQRYIMPRVLGLHITLQTQQAIYLLICASCFQTPQLSQYAAHSTH